MFSAMQDVDQARKPEILFVNLDKKL